MSRFRAELDNRGAHIRSLRWTCGLLVMLLVGSLVGWDRARQDLRVIVPPDLRSGVTLTATTIPPASIYAFAYYIFQQLHRWPHDGAKEYPEAIYRLASYMTPAFETEVLADLKFKGKNGELSYRTRALYEAPGNHFEDAKVQLLGNDAWIVQLDVQIIEAVQGMKVKETRVRYPLRIVRYDTDPERNPWGLALDGYAEPPHRLDPTENTASQMEVP